MNSKPELSLDVLNALGKTELQTRETLDTLVETSFPFPFLLVDWGEATKILKAGATKAFRTKIEFYRSQPGFCLAWLDEAAFETVSRFIQVVPYRFKFGSRFDMAKIQEALKTEVQAIAAETASISKPSWRAPAGEIFPQGIVKGTMEASANSEQQLRRLASAEQELEEAHEQMREIVDSGEFPAQATETISAELIQNEADRAGRAARRQAVVGPILKKKRWTPNRLATEAAVGKNSVYEYLDGTRVRITKANRKALADALNIEPEKLPD